MIPIDIDFIFLYRIITMNKLNDEKTLALYCKALSHPARIHIIKYLMEKDRCICGQLVEELPLAQSTVSQHLKMLKKSGIIRGEIEGPKTCYCIDKIELKKCINLFNNQFKNGSKDLKPEDD